MPPCCLDLRLYCLSKMPVKDRPDIWPALPLVIEGDMNTDIIITALGQSNRVRHAILGLAGCQSLAPMQVPFPELTDLCLRTDDGTQPVISDSFLGGSAPRLRTLKSFPYHFRDCRNYFCPLLASSIYYSMIFLILGTFHPKRWSLSSPFCPTSKHFFLGSNLLNITLTRKAEVYLCQNAPSSLLLTKFVSSVLPNIWRNS